MSTETTHDTAEAQRGDHDTPDWVFSGDGGDPTDSPTGRTVETQQGVPIVRGYDAPKHYPTDAEAARKHRFGVPTLNPEQWSAEEGNAVSAVYPDMLLHVADPRAPDVPSTIESDGGALVAVEAPKGSGKSTVMDQWAVYQMDHAERVVRNGRQKSSEWRRMSDWATVWLPDGVEIDTRWLEVTDYDDPDLEEICREVRYYDDVRELVERLQQTPRGTYHVVYPDPLFRRCEDVIEQADASGVGEIEFRPKGLPDPTPASNWWFAFITERLLFGRRRDADGRPQFMNLHYDELRSLAPINPKKGPESHYLRELIETVSENSIESRKAGLSIYAYTQSADRTSHIWLSEFDYWVELSKRGRSNRVSKGDSPPPFRDLPMDTDLIGSRPIGFGVAYHEGKFSEFRWSDLGQPMNTPEFGLELGVVSSRAEREQSSGIHTEAVRYVDELIAEFNTGDGSVHELRVRDPGSGRISLTGDRPEIADDLESPTTDTEFPASPLSDSSSGWELHWRNDSGEEIVVARIPKAGHGGRA